MLNKPPMTKKLISICIITVACCVGGFFGVIIYELVNFYLQTGAWSAEVLFTPLFSIKLISVLTATGVGAVMQEIIIPVQHKFTFWRYIQQRNLAGFTLLSGASLGVGGALAIALSVFITERISLADFFVKNYADRCLSILPAAFIFGTCYGFGRFKSYAQQFGF